MSKQPQVSRGKSSLTDLKVKIAIEILLHEGVVDKITDVVEVFNAHIRTQGGPITLKNTQVSHVS